MALPLLSVEARRLEGKVAIITGGAKGIGEYAAKVFTQHGAKVVIADINDELGQALCKELGPTAQYLHCDVTNEADVENAVQHTMAQYGKLDIMYNNAGILDSVDDPNISESTASSFEKVMKVNVLGSYLGTKHAARVMIPAKQGSIITTASTCSVIGGGAPYSYVTSKHALVGMMKNGAVELGKYGIRVNCVSPHIVDTSLAREFLDADNEEVFDGFYTNLKGKRCRVDDVANAALFLASDEAKFISGHNLVVDGGVTALNVGFCLYE